MEAGAEDGIVYIYALCDPRDDEVRYVGQTKRVLDDRLGGHMHDGRHQDSSNTAKGRWLRELYDVGLIPTVRLLQQARTSTADDAEWHWITALARQGAALLNVQVARCKPRVASVAPSLGAPPPDALTVPQAAQCLGVSARRVRQYIASGRLPARRHGRDLFVLHADVRAFQRRPPGRPGGPTPGLTPDEVALLREAIAGEMTDTPSRTIDN